MELQTERLLLRHWHENDAKLFLSYQQEWADEATKNS
jgi:hypothetical protein